MSYFIPTKIQINEDGVFLTGGDNNVTPRTNDTFRSESLSKMLEEQGRDAVDIAILKDYQNGNIQGGNNKYTRALEVLRHLPEFREYKDNEPDFSAGYEVRKAYKEDNKQKYDAILLKALKTPKPKDKYVITRKDYSGVSEYMYHRKNAGFCRFYKQIKHAKVFNWKEDAENYNKYFTNAEDWKVIKIT